MKGNIKVVVSTKKLRYELNLRRNITIIQGDSATGKTTLIQIINDYLSGRTGPGTDVICKKKCEYYPEILKVYLSVWKDYLTPLCLPMNRNIFYIPKDLQLPY